MAHILLVDDEKVARALYGDFLTGAGHTVTAVGTSAEGREVLLKQKFDLVVTDLEMPRTNGYELLSHLRQDAKTRSIPVMVVTSRAGAKHRDRAIKEGAMAFLTKPVQEDQFIAAVSKLIGTPAGQAMEKAAAG